MKKIILLLWIALVPMTFIRAQNDLENKEVHEQLNDWAVVKLTIAYMEDLYLFTPEVKGAKGTNKEYSTYKSLSDNYQNYSSEKEIDLNSVGQILEQGDWVTTKKDVFDKYKEYFFASESSFISIEPYGYKEGNTQQNFNNTKKAINNEYKKILKENSAIEEELQKELKEKTMENYGETLIVRNPLERSSGLLFWIYGILGILVSFIVILINKNRNLKRSLKRAKHKPKISYSNLDHSNLDDIRKLRENIQCLKNDNKDLKEENETLKVRLENFKNSVGVKINKTHNSESPSQAIDLEFHQPKANNLIYLPSPFRNLTFANEDASKEKSLNSLYKVDLNEHMQTGVLTILVDADLSRALNSPNTYLETACVYDNEHSNNARAIKVIENGEIKLNGEDWIVTKKVRIKFI